MKPQKGRSPICSLLKTVYALDGKPAGTGQLMQLVISDVVSEETAKCVLHDVAQFYANEGGDASKQQLTDLRSCAELRIFTLTCVISACSL